MILTGYIEVCYILNILSSLFLQTILNLYTDLKTSFELKLMIETKTNNYVSVLNNNKPCE